MGINVTDGSTSSEPPVMTIYFPSSPFLHAIKKYLTSINLPFPTVLFSPGDAAWVSAVARECAVKQTGELGVAARHRKDGVWVLLSGTDVFWGLCTWSSCSQRETWTSSSWGVLQLLQSFTCFTCSGLVSLLQSHR